VGLAAAVALGAIVELAFVRRFAKASRLVLTVATIGIAQLLAALALLVWNAAPQPKLDIVPSFTSGVCSAAAISFSAVDLPAHSTHDDQPRRMEHLGAMYADLRSKHASLLRGLYIVELGTARSTIPTQMRKSEHLTS
jgi:hypothetical protein